MIDASASDGSLCGISELSSDYGIVTYEMTQTLDACATIAQAIYVCEIVTINNVTGFVSSSDATTISSETIDWCFVSLNPSQTHIVEVSGSNAISISSSSLNNREIAFESNVTQANTNEMPVISVNNSVFSGDDSSAYSLFTIGDYSGTLIFSGIRFNGDGTKLGWLFFDILFVVLFFCLFVSFRLLAHLV